MNVYAPDYYPMFSCIAGRCTHTCCAGWEIDIDARTLEKYGVLLGAIGEKVRAGISLEGAPHFATGADGRCPLLRSDGLCDLILETGEENLCDICRDHPRFRNFMSGRTEIGLGLVCEEAARIILTRETPMKLVLIAGNGKEKLNRAEKYLLRERGLLLAGIRAQGPKARFLEYLVYRHLADALYHDDMERRVAFIRCAYKTVTAEWDTSGMIEACRTFSDTVEYDDEALTEWMNEAVKAEAGRYTLSDLA